MVTIAAMLSLATKAASAQTGPEDVVRAFFKAEDEGRWVDAARMLELKRFEPFLASSIRNLRSIPRVQLHTADDLMKLEPDMPRAVAEYQAKKMSEGARDFNFIEREFAHVNTVDSLAVLSPETAAARWLEATSPAWQEELARREMAKTPAVNCPPLPDSIRREMAKLVTSRLYPTVRILGTTSGSDSVRYVVVSDAIVGIGVNGPGMFEGESFSSPRAMILRRIDSYWKIVPTNDLPRNDAMGSSAVFSIRCKNDSTEKPGHE